MSRDIAFSSRSTFCSLWPRQFLQEKRKEARRKATGGKGCEGKRDKTCRVPAMRRLSESHRGWFIVVDISNGIPDGRASDEAAMGINRPILLDL